MAARSASRYSNRGRVPRAERKTGYVEEETAAVRHQRQQECDKAGRSPASPRQTPPRPTVCRSPEIPPAEEWRLPRAAIFRYELFCWRVFTFLRLAPTFRTAAFNIQRISWQTNIVTVRVGRFVEVNILIILFFSCHVHLRHLDGRESCRYVVRIFGNSH